MTQPPQRPRSLSIPARIRNVRTPPSSWVSYLQKHGYDNAAIYKTLVDYGFTTSRAQVDTVASEIASSRLKAPRLQTVVSNRRPQADEISTWTTRRKTGFLYHFDVLVNITGTDVVMRSPWSVRYDSLVTYRRAIEDVLANYADSQETSMPDEIPLGATILGVFEMVPGE